MSDECEELLELFKLSYQLLHAKSDLAAIVETRIWRSQVPPKTDKTLPYILGDYFTGNDFNGTGSVRLLTRPLILWRVVRKGQLTTEMSTAAKFMDGVLRSIRAVTSGGYSFSVQRERPHMRTTYDDALNAYEELGGFYRYSISEVQS